MAILRASPFNLVRGDLIAVRVRAANIRGFQASYSAVNTVGQTVETEPDAPSPVTRTAGSATSISVSWSAIVANSVASGGTTTSATSYHL